MTCTFDIDGAHDQLGIEITAGRRWPCLNRSQQARSADEAFSFLYDTIISDTKASLPSQLPHLLSIELRNIHTEHTFQPEQLQGIRHCRRLDRDFGVLFRLPR
jgi:hypothetical protein